MKLQELSNIAGNFKSREKMTPLIFVGHGHPMNALWNNSFTQSLTSLGHSIDKPNAVLVISAHWETVGTYVSITQKPRTIHDFGGFPNELYRVRYEPDGHTALARDLKHLVTMTNVMEDAEMGLDHGAWTVLRFIWPHADVPVFQMSMDYTQAPEYHYQLGQQLKTLRQKGVLILCSGNIVHNLSLADFTNMNAKPYDWTIEFDEYVKHHIDRRNFKNLVNYHQMGTAAKLAIPTNDHYLPLIYAAGIAGADEPVEHIFEGYQFASLSMRCFQIG